MAGQQIGAGSIKIQRHLNSSPTSMIDSLDQLTKGAEIVMHSAVLLRTRVIELQVANEAATRRKLHKRERVQKEGALTIEDGARLTALKEFGAQGDGIKGKKKARVDGSNSLRGAVDGAARQGITLVHVKRKRMCL